MSIEPDMPCVVTIRLAMGTVLLINFVMKILFVTILYFNLSVSRDCKVLC